MRTRVHEYGGGAFAVANGTVVLLDFADQRVYRLTPGGDAARRSPRAGDCASPTTASTAARGG